MEKFLGGFPNSIIMADREECICTNCGGTIGADDDYLSLLGESLHFVCLTDRLQKMNILQIVVRRKEDKH